MDFDADGPERVRRLFERHAAVGLHHGAQLVAYHEGDRVLDLTAGTTGPDGEAVGPDTRFFLWSATKPLAGACVHHLVDRGLLDYDDRVRGHWPAFADPDTEKAATTVRHVLSHRAGLERTPFDRRVDRWDDWDAAVAAMEAADPASPPGSAAAYHSLSYGWLVGELVRRVSGTPVDRYAREHLFDPLGMDDTGIGLEPDEPADVATVAGFEEFDRCRRPEAGRLEVDNATTATVANDERVQRATVPAANGIGTARDLARFFACLANGGELDGTRILSAGAVDRATACQVETPEDGLLGVPRRYALGFVLGGLAHDAYGILSPARVFGHGGHGSVVAWADPREDLAVAYVTNGIRDGFEHDSRVAAVGEAVRTVWG